MAEEGSGVVYRERIGYPPKILLIIMAPAIIFLIVLIGAVMNGSLTWIIVSVGVLVTMGAVWLGFGSLLFEVTDDAVTFGFKVYKKSFPVASLVSCEKFELEFGNYGGYGVRPGRDGSTAYNTRSGPGIKMVFEGQPRPYVVSVNNPEKACKALKKASKSASA